MEEMCMRLAIFTDTFEPDVNGVARTLGRWVSYLRKQGVPVLVFAPDPLRPHGDKAPSHDVERFISLPFLLYPECRLALPNPIHIRKQLEAFKPTLVHVATPFNLGLCGVHYARKYNVPLIASYHTHFDQYLPFYNLQWMEKMLWKYMHWFHEDCRRIFVPSRSTLNDLTAKGWSSSKLDLWSRGIDTRQFHPLVDRESWLTKHGIGNDKYVVFYAGRLAPEKRVETALDAFSAFWAGGKRDVCMVIAGDGPSADCLKERCEQEGLPVYFAGFQPADQLQRWYASADVFLFPSPTETFGNVVLEAMACGTPVITANEGGVTDSVEHMVSGITCASGDAADFCRSLELLYHDRELAESMGKRGLAHSIKQSWDYIFEQFAHKCRAISASEERQAAGIGGVR